MSKLTIYNEDTKILEKLDSDAEISKRLKEVGVDFYQWKADKEITEDMDQNAIIEAYKSEVDKLVSSKGYQAVDVVSMFPNHPEKKMLREKFLSEHTHSEDEVRFFVRGQGLFSMHIGDEVYSILCNRNDLISVPANTPHWFDMGENPEFSAIRLFNNPDGWVAKFTGNKIADRFPKISIITIFLFLLFSGTSMAQTTKLAVWGKIIEHESTINNYKYFVTYTENGKSYAYPLDLRNYKQKDLKPLNNKFVKIEGLINTTTFKLEGQEQKTTVVYPNKIQPMKSSDLSIGNYYPTERDLVKNPETKNNAVNRSGGFELSDKVANSAIFAGAALLLGSILSK